jgi:hypothetical protein
MTTTTTDFRPAAEARVAASETLNAHRDLLLDYDWSNADEHAEWVATAPESEILSWVETIRRDERAGAGPVLGDRSAPPTVSPRRAPQAA